jgi:hypothetical protein
VAEGLARFDGVVPPKGACPPEKGQSARLRRIDSPEDTVRRNGDRRIRGIRADDAWRKEVTSHRKDRL